MRMRLSFIRRSLALAATRAALYPGMSLVNNFRVLFTTAFGATDLPLLPDRTFYSDPDRIYDLEEIDLSGNFLKPRLHPDHAN